MDNKAIISGNLKFISLADIFQLLGTNNSTGTLYLSSQYAPHTGMIYFLNGDPINAALGNLRGIEAIYPMFGWTEGRFEFQDEEVHIERSLKQSRMEIVLDALRMLDEGMIKKVGPLSFGEEEFSKRVDGNGNNGLPVIKGSMIDYSYVVKEEVFKDGQQIVGEGKYGKWMWIVYEGIVNISRKTDTGYLKIARLGDGSFIGTFKSLLFRDHGRSATVTAEGDVRLCLLDIQHLHNEYICLSPTFRAFLISLDERLNRVTDRAAELYGKKDDNQALKNGERIIIQKGSSLEDLFIIKEGEAYIIGQNPEGTLHLLTLKEDDVFGYISFLDFGHEPRSAYVLGSNDLVVEKLDIQSLQEEYSKLSSTFKNLIYHVGTCISMTTRLAYQLNYST